MLAQGPLLIDKNLTLVGPTSDDLALDGNGATAVFRLGTVTPSRLTISHLDVQRGLPTTGNAGGIDVVAGSTLTLTSLTLSGNYEGLYNQGVAVLTNVTVTGDLYAGIINFGTLTLTNVTISHTNGRALGGGLHNGSGATATLTNVTISHNVTTADGGGIFNSGTLSLTNVTISENAGDLGGGICNSCEGSATGTLSLRNTIIAGNADNFGGVDFYSPDGSPVTSGGHNLVGVSFAPGVSNGVNDDIAGTPQAPVDARLGPLADNGGPTQTRALRAGSPAIDAGSGGPSTDQRGLPRAGAAGLPDIGAFEIQPPTVDLNGGASGSGFSASYAEGQPAQAPIVSASGLTVTATSSNLTLVPNANIAIGGSGPTRTITLTPASGQSGTATITATVNDGTMTATRQFTLTVTPPPMACTPRPAVLTQPIAGGGKLQVTIRATALEGLTNNRLRGIRFGDPANGVANLQNARVTLASQAHTSSFTYAVPPGTVEVTFTIERVTAGQPTTVHLAVVDGCGTWKTFVGGGTGAAF